MIISPYLNRLAAHFDSTINPIPLPADKHVDLPYVLQIYNYYKQHGIKTIVLGASIVHVEEVELIAGLDAITIFPPLLQKVAQRKGISVTLSFSFPSFLFSLSPPFLFPSPSLALPATPLVSFPTYSLSLSYSIYAT